MRLVLAAVLAAGCNSFIGIEDVALVGDAGSDQIDAGEGELDAGEIEVDAAVDAAPPPRVGNAIEFDGMSDIPAGFDLARKVVFPSDTSVIGFGVITKASSATGQLRMGLYEDNGNNAPGAFVTRTAVIAGYELGENVFDVAAAPIDSGVDHWIAIAFEGAAPVGADSSAQVDACFIMRQFDSAIDSNGFGVATCNTGDALNLFVVVENL